MNKEDLSVYIKVDKNGVIQRIEIADSYVYGKSFINVSMEGLGTLFNACLATRLKTTQKMLIGYMDMLNQLNRSKAAMSTEEVTAAVKAETQAIEQAKGGTVLTHQALVYQRRA